MREEVIVLMVFAVEIPSTIDAINSRAQGISSIAMVFDTNARREGSLFVLGMFMTESEP